MSAPFFGSTNATGVDEQAPETVRGPSEAAAKTGAVVSRTTTRLVHETALPASSTAPWLTLVVPRR